MKSFIGRIFENKIDEKVHEQFVRFGKGDYKTRAVVSCQKTSLLKLKGSFEYANDFSLFAAENSNSNFSGIILSKEKLEFENEKEKSGIYSYEVSDVSSDKIKEIYHKIYYLLLDCSGSGINLKMKKKLPKPGKSGEGKVDDKFCQLELDLKYFSKVRETFFWDVPDFKKISSSHNYLVTDLVIPRDEKDFVQMRLKTKRKGILTRKLVIDKNEVEKKINFEV